MRTTRITSRVEPTSQREMDVAEVLTFRAENECIRMGGKVSSFDDMKLATQRVLRSDPKLATRYFQDPMETATDEDMRGAT